MDRKNPTFIRFMQILNDITKEQKRISEEDKTRSYWDRSLIDSWERLIDRSEEKNFDFFVVKENLLLEVESFQKKNSESESIKADVEEEKKDEPKAK